MEEPFPHGAHTLFVRSTLLKAGRLYKAMNTRRGGATGGLLRDWMSHKKMHFYIVIFYLTVGYSYVLLKIPTTVD